MAQAIITKYYGPTNHRASRIVAKCRAGRETFSCNDDVMGDLTIDQQHEQAAYDLADELGWLDRYRLASGTLPDGNGCHVLVD